MLGSGPGGYTAAFRAADLGLERRLIERYPTLGGVCLNVGCIPSKALLHAAKVIEEAEEMAECGMKFGKPEIDPGALRDWKNKVVGRLTGGLAGWPSSARSGCAGHGQVRVAASHRGAGDGDGRQVVAFEQCIIAAGSAGREDSGLARGSARSSTRPARSN